MKLYFGSLFSWPSTWAQAGSTLWSLGVNIQHSLRKQGAQSPGRESTSSLQTSIKKQQCHSYIGWLSQERSPSFGFKKGGLASLPGPFPSEEHTPQLEQQIRLLSCPGTCGFGETERTSLNSLWTLYHFQEIANQKKCLSFGRGRQRERKFTLFTETQTLYNFTLL